MIVAFNLKLVPLWAALREVHDLERNVFSSKHCRKLSAGGCCAEHHLRPQQQRSSRGFGVQDVMRTSLKS
jgi:hypothetical protein